MAIAIVVLLFFGVMAILLVRGAADVIEKQAEIEEAQIRADCIFPN